MCAQTFYLYKKNKIHCNEKWWLIKVYFLLYQISKTNCNPSLQKQSYASLLLYRAGTMGVE